MIIVKDLSEHLIFSKKYNFQRQDKMKKELSFYSTFSIIPTAL